MKIDSTNVRGGLLDVEQNEGTERAQGASKEDRTAGTSRAAGDGVALSSRLRQLRALASEITDVSAVDRSRVDELRSQVEAGAFAPAADAVARSLFGEVTANGGG